MDNGFEKVKNPCKKFLKYSGGTGLLSYWDKDAAKKVELKNPVSFTEITTLSTIVGWDEKSSSNIYSNEVASTKTPFTIRSKDGELCTGVWKDISDVAKGKGAKFAVSVYAILDKELVNIKFSGSALKPYFDKEAGSLVTITGSEKQKKGATEYVTPIFECSHLDDASEQEAMGLARPAIEYIEAKLKAKPETAVSEPVAQENTQDISPEDLPF